MFSPGTGIFSRATRLILPGWTNQHRETGRVFPGDREYFPGSPANFTGPGLTGPGKPVMFSPSAGVFPEQPD